MSIYIGLLILASICVVAVSGIFALIESSLVIMDDRKLNLLLNREDIPEKKKKRIEKIMNKNRTHK